MPIKRFLAVLLKLAFCLQPLSSAVAKYEYKLKAEKRSAESIKGATIVDAEAAKNYLMKMWLLLAVNKDVQKICYFRGGLPALCKAGCPVNNEL